MIRRNYGPHDFYRRRCNLRFFKISLKLFINQLINLKKICFQIWGFGVQGLKVLGSRV